MTIFSHCPPIDLFPGPIVEARSGDTLIITVNNALGEQPIALHWHGLHVASELTVSPQISSWSSS